MRLSIVFILLTIVEKLILMFLHSYWTIEFSHAFLLVIRKYIFVPVFIVFGIVGILLTEVMVRHLFVIHINFSVWLD